MTIARLSLTLVRLVPLGLMFATGLDLAHAAPRPSVPSTPPQPLVTKTPETCSDQCGVLEKACSNPCQKAKKPNARTACKANCDQLIAACEGSCKEKGTIDPDYMKQHIKPPKAPPAPRTK